MKKFLVLFVLFVPALAMAEEIVLDVPNWVGWLVGFAFKLPTVGPILLQAAAYAGFASVALTLVATFLSGFSRGLSAIAPLLPVAKAQAFCVKVVAVIEKVNPWIKWFSMYNVQKIKKG